MDNPELSLPKHNLALDPRAVADLQRNGVILVGPDTIDLSGLDSDVTCIAKNMAEQPGQRFNKEQLNGFTQSEDPIVIPKVLQNIQTCAQDRLPELVLARYFHARAGRYWLA